MTAKEIIEQIKALPADEVQEVVDFVCEMEKTEFLPASKMEEIYRFADEADRGINVSPRFTSAKEAIAWLKTENRDQ